jgi:hypothetical protein
MTARDHAQAATLPAEPGEAAPVRLPAIKVRTDRGEVAAFLRETGGIGTGDFVPLTFPFRWLTLPAIRGLILQLSGGEGFLPVHEAQSFAYERSLRADTDYILDVAFQTAEKPPRLILKMAVSTVQDSNGRTEICAHLETILRIVRLSPEIPS